MFQKLNFREQTFLVYGLGLSGLSVVKFFINNKIKNFKVWDDKKENELKKYRAQNLKHALKQVDFIVLAPGISITKNKNLARFKKKIITDIDLFYLFKNKSKSVVVTGTNGKSTTCKLLHHLLKNNKIKCLIGGNIGTPILDLKVTKSSFVIIEASSFQLSHSKFINPDYAFFLNLTNDHLDWHGNMKNYLNSKMKIFEHQNENQFALINKEFIKIFNKKNFLSKKIIPRNHDYKKLKSKIKNNYLNSSINDENMSFVYTFAKIMKIKDGDFIKTMRSFRGLPHRFEIFLKKRGVTFINDSKATSFKATQSALSSINNIYWILGGLPKKGDKINISKLKKNIIKCYLIGKNTNFFKNQLKGKLSISITANLKNSIIQILKDRKIQKPLNSSILLSPAAASFDQFENFEKRGEEFKKISKKYANKFT